MNRIRTGWGTCSRWLCKEEHMRAAHKVRAEVGHAFTGHPHETGETYLEHLWFTLNMSLRFMLVTLIMLAHGFFPFLLTRAASRQTERIYGIMKGRIPKWRREELDAIANGPDYSV